MNTAYRLIWDDQRHMLVIVAENGRARGKKAGKSVRRAVLPAILFSAALAGTAVAPWGGEAWAARVCQPNDTNPATATGGLALACGENASAGNNATAIGGSAKAASVLAVAVGYNASATKTSATAIGGGGTYNSGLGNVVKNAASATGVASVALGGAYYDTTGTTLTQRRNRSADGANASGDRAVAVGSGSSASTDAVAVGYNAKAQAQDAIAVGRGARAEGTENIAIGANTRAYEQTPNSIAIGSGQAGIGRDKVWNESTQTWGDYGAKDDAGQAGKSIAIGYKANNFTYGYDNKEGWYANTTSTVAIGNLSHTHAAYAIAIGTSTDATAERAFAIGTSSTNTTAQHLGARAGGQGSIVFGDTAIVKGQGLTSVSGGVQEDRATYTSVNDAIAVGTNTLAQARNAVVVGGGMSYTYHQVSSDGKTMINQTQYYDGNGWTAGRAEGVGAKVGLKADGAVAIGGATGTVEGIDETFPTQALSGRISDYTAAATIGDNAKRAVAVGSGSRIGDDAVNSVAVGARNIVTAKNSTAVGQANQVAGEGAGAFGDPNHVSGDGSYAFGDDNKVGKYEFDTNNVLKKDQTTKDVFVVGSNNEIGKNDGNSSKINVVGNTNKIESGNGTTADYINVFGSDNTFTGAGSTNKIVKSSIVGNDNSFTSITRKAGATGTPGNIFVLGNSVHTVAEDSVFLGDASAYVADKGDGGKTGSTIGLLAYSTNTNPIYAKNIDPATPGTAKPIFAIGNLAFAGGDDVAGVVSVGGKSTTSGGATTISTRRIQNVAPGLISAGSTDAINGSQLYAVIGGVMPLAGNNVEITYDVATGRPIIHALNAIVNTNGSGGGSGSGNGSAPTTGSGSGNASTGNTPTSTANTGSLVNDGSQSGIAHTANAHTTTYYAVSPQDFEDLVNGGDPNNGTYGLMVGATPVGQDMTAGQALKNSLFSVKGGEGQELAAALAAGETLKGGDPSGYSARNLTTRLSSNASSGSNSVYVMMSENPTFGRGSRQVKISGDSGSVTTTDGSSTTTVNPQGMTISGTGSYQPVVIQQGNVSMGGNRIQNVAAGVNDTDAVNVSQLKSQHINISDGRNTTGVYGGDTMRFRGDRNIHVSVDGLDINITLDPDLNVRSVTTGRARMDNDGFHIKGGPSVTVNGIDAAGKRITNVADGIHPYDAVNRGQLNALDNRLSNRIDKAYGGIATVAASVGVPQTTIPGTNMLSAALGGFEGETALAVGYSAMSDNGHWIWKNVLSASSEEVTWTTGLGFLW